MGRKAAITRSISGHGLPFLPEKEYSVSRSWFEALPDHFAAEQQRRTLTIILTLSHDAQHSVCLLEAFKAVIQQAFSCAVTGSELELSCCKAEVLTSTVYCHAHAEPNSYTLFLCAPSTGRQAKPQIEQMRVVRGSTIHVEALLHWHRRQGARVCVQLCLYQIPLGGLHRHIGPQLR